MFLRSFPGFCWWLPFLHLSTLTWGHTADKDLPLFDTNKFLSKKYLSFSMELYSSAFQIKSNDVKCRVEWWSGSGDIRSGSQAWLLMRSQQPILLILILVKSCPPLSRTLTCFSTLYTLRENYFREMFWLSPTGCGSIFRKAKTLLAISVLGDKTWINGAIKRWGRSSHRLGLNTNKASDAASSTCL